MYSSCQGDAGVEGVRRVSHVYAKQLEKSRLSQHSHGGRRDKGTSQTPDNSQTKKNIYLREGAYFLQLSYTYKYATKYAVSRNAKNLKTLTHYFFLAIENVIELWRCDETNHFFSFVTSCTFFDGVQIHFCFIRTFEYVNLSIRIW